VTPWGAIAHILASLGLLESKQHQLETRVDAIEAALRSAYTTRGSKCFPTFPQFQEKKKAEPLSEPAVCQCGDFWCPKCSVPFTITAME
jgi:hypothetical protein